MPASGFYFEQIVNFDEKINSKYFQIPRLQVQKEENEGILYMQIRV